MAGPDMKVAIELDAETERLLGEVTNLQLQLGRELRQVTVVAWLALFVSIIAVGLRMFGPLF